MEKSPEQIYRYRTLPTSFGNVKVFESRYYADKYIKDHLTDPTDYEVSFRTYYEVSFLDDFNGFVIFMFVRLLLVDDLENASDNG